MTRVDDGAMRLRDGHPVWLGGPLSAPERTAPPVALETDIVVIGAGSTGSFLAERFTRDGFRVALIDRHAPAMGSTAASTAMLLWELDASLLEIEDRLGSEAAAAISSACRQHVFTIGKLVQRLGIDCDFAFRPSLYLAGNRLDSVDLREEHRLRAHLGIEGACIDEGGLAARGIRGESGLLYPGAAEVDPVKLARGLLAAARARGARLLSPATAMVYETLRDGVRVETREGDVVRARTLVLANGYEMPDFVPIPAGGHTIVSTWAYATERGIAPAWPDNALVWEASDPYLYMRTTADGRVIVGGADEEDVDDTRRKSLTPEKIAKLEVDSSNRVMALAERRPEFAWSGAFGQTGDSLPLIGQAPGRPFCFAAFGYGGNGLTFSALAATMLAGQLAGEDPPLARLCGLDRA
jgi:glycine/D-amino acid oxidase-like deaminating enzyme